MAVDFTNIDPQALNLSRAIALQESSKDGKTPNYSAVGDNGTSKGAYQWQPGNFEANAKSAGLDPSDFSPQNQDKVAYATVKGYKDKGFQPAEIASMWSSGSPNNWQNHAGKTFINGKLISFDTPSYVKNVQKYYQGLSSGTPQSSKLQPPTFSYNNQVMDSNHDANAALMKGAGNYLFPIAGDIKDVATGKNTKTGLQIAADAGLSALPFIPVGGEIGEAARAGAFAGKIGAQEAVRGGIGYAAGTAQNLSQGQGFGQAVTPNASNVGGALTAAGLPLAVSGIRGAARSLVSNTVKDVTPSLGAKGSVAATQDLGNTESIFGKIKRNPDPHVAEVAQNVDTNIPSFGTLKTYSDKLNAVKNTIGTLAQRLRTNLRGDIRPLLTPEDLQTLQAQMQQEIDRNPLLTGDAATQAQKIFNEFTRNLPQKGDITMENVLDARQAVDRWIQQIKGGSVFDPKTENAISVGLRAVRQGANTLIDAKVPEAGVKDLLRQQTLLYDAEDALAQKANSEIGTTPFSRAMTAHPMISGLVKTGLKGLGTIGAGAVGVAGYQHIFPQNSQ